MSRRSSGCSRAAASGRRCERDATGAEFLDRIAATDPIPGAALLDAARLLAALGWTDSAKAAWQRAVALEPSLKTR